MDDPTKFNNILTFNIFMISFFALIGLELLIAVITGRFKDRSKKASDRGTVWLIICGYASSIFLSTYLVSQEVPVYIRELKFPTIFEYIGIAFVWIGIIVRVVSVITLNKAFTYTVQTTEKQSLIQKGFYKYVRNPAYTGSILSLLGVAFAYRSILAPFVVLVICLFCYSIRIHIEEKELKKQFGDEFIEYEKHTSRLIPFIY